MGISGTTTSRGGSIDLDAAITESGEPAGPDQGRSGVKPQPVSTGRPLTRNTPVSAGVANTARKIAPSRC